MHNKNSQSYDFSSRFDTDDKAVWHLKYKEDLGSGAFGKVILCFNEKLRRNCAVKIINKQHLKDKEVIAFREEARILASLSHKNIVELYEVIETGKNIYLVMEIVQEGSLRNLLQRRAKEGRYFSEGEAARIMEGILNALTYIHDNNIVHRDLKPENILIAGEASSIEVKLADFGLSSNFKSEDICTKFLQKMCGTVLYMAPEILGNQEYSKPVDLWSCGIIMYEVITLGRHPLKLKSDNIFNQNNQSYVERIQNPRWEFDANFSELSKDLFLKLVASRPSERYTAVQAANHPWITRKTYDSIPMTFEQKFKIFHKELEMSKILKSVYFLAFLKAFFLEKIKTPNSNRHFEFSHEEIMKEHYRRKSRKPKHPFEKANLTLQKPKQKSPANSKTKTTTGSASGRYFGWTTQSTP